MRLFRAFVCALSFVVVTSCAAAPASTTAVEATSADPFVIAANPLAAEAGLNVLKRGGSAVDAAIAVQMVLNLVEPQSSGIGGGAFMLHYDKGANKLLAYDGRETAPKAATPNLFIGADGKPLAFLAAVDGGLSVGTPGVLRMLEAAHKAHGKLPWKDLFEPAIKLSEEGFAISQRMSVSIAGTAARIKAQGEPGSSYFLNADGTAKAAGTLLKNPEFAATLKAIAAGGADAFYKGDIAKDIVAKVVSHPTNPGKLALDDLSDYTHKVREPVDSPLALHEVVRPYLRRLRVEQVDDVVRGGPSDLRRELLQLVGVAAAHAHVRVAPHEPFDHGRAEVSGRPGHRDDLPGEPRRAGGFHVLDATSGPVLDGAEPDASGSDRSWPANEEERRCRREGCGGSAATSPDS